MLHAFVDGTSRTNHLLLNKLLVENGMYPITLKMPNAPCLTVAEWAKVVEDQVAAAEHEAKTMTAIPDDKPVADAKNSILPYERGFVTDSPDWLDADFPSETSDAEYLDDDFT